MLKYSWIYIIFSFGGVRFAFISQRDEEEGDARSEKMEKIGREVGLVFTSRGGVGVS